MDLSQNMLEGDASVLFGANKVNLQKINLAKNLLAFDLGKIFFGLRSSTIHVADDVFS